MMDHSGGGTSVRQGSSDFRRFGSVSEPAREIEVTHEPDVLVVGGGPAGIGAAVAAARNGARGTGNPNPEESIQASGV